MPLKTVQVSLHPTFLRRVVPLVFAATVGFSAAFVPNVALAHGSAADAPPPPTPKAPPGDGATAESLLKKLEALGPKIQTVIVEPVKQAKKALERAHGARTAGDTTHARLLDALALEWAQTAEMLAQAAASEETATTAQKQAADAATQLERARTLLEETQARKGRAEAELARVEAEAKQAAADAKAAEEARLGGGKKGKDAKDAKGKDTKAKDAKGADAKGGAKPAPKKGSK
ncbi:MAG: hypothetical protein IPK82_39960 [Polyangiaceae bacterium]|nr:hypothetical protein [Polyangiaceae bacterium]